MSRLADALKSGEFVVSAELNPPKGTDLGPLLAKAEALAGLVDAFNVTDSHTSRMTMAPIAAARALLNHGFEPLLQITCRDRNRIALQADLLAASALGIANIMCMTGDDPKTGDHPEAKPVFDLEAVGLLRAASSLRSGKDMGGRKLRGSPVFFAGAVVNSGAPDLSKELLRMQQKIEAGAQFFQTQAVYDPDAFQRFMGVARESNVPFLATLIVLKSGEMAKRFNAEVPGICIPEDLVQEMEDAQNPADKGVEIASRLLQRLKPMCQGIHIIDAGRDSRIPEILRIAGIQNTASPRP